MTTITLPLARAPARPTARSRPFDAEPWGRLFHAAVKVAPSVPLPPWPEEWLTVSRKHHPRYEAVPLPEVTTEATLSACVRARASRRAFGPLGLDDLAGVLRLGAGAGIDGRRPYGSAGNRQTVEVYAWLPRVSGVTPALYHYEPDMAALRRLPYIIEPEAAFRTEWVRSAPCVLMLTAAFERSTMKYGTHGYKFAYLEAGAAVHALQLAATARGLVSCAYSGADPSAVEPALEVDGLSESLVISLALGGGA